MNLFGKRLDDNAKVYSSISKIKGVSASAQGTAVDLCLSIGIGKECTVQDVPSDKWSIITELLSAGSTGGREAAIKRELKRVQRSKVLYRLTPRQTALTGDSIKTTVDDVSVAPASLAVQYKKARQLTQEYVEGKLLKSIKDNIDRLQKTRSYRGLRHLEGLPCRGQRTHTNGGRRKRIAKK